MTDELRHSPGKIFSPKKLSMRPANLKGGLLFQNARKEIARAGGRVYRRWIA